MKIGLTSPSFRECKQRDEDLTERFASSKSWNWKAGAQVQPMKKKWFSTSLGGALSIVPYGGNADFLCCRGPEPNHTFGGTVYCSRWLSSRLGPRQVSLTCPSLSFNSTIWKKISMVVEKKVTKEKSNYSGKEAARLKIV